MVEYIFRKNQGVPVLEISGSITGAEEAIDISSSLDKLLGEGCSNIVLNLDGVEIIDDAGRAFLYNALHRTHLCGGEMKFVRSGELKGEWLPLIVVYQSFDFYRTEEEAIRSLSEEVPFKGESADAWW